jgi:hypothetical protein
LKGKEPEGTSAVREPSAFQSLILELHVNESNGTSTAIEAKAEPFLLSIVLSFSLYSSYFIYFFTFGLYLERTKKRPNGG